MGFPAQRRSKLHATNPPERPNKAAKRRADVVGIVPGEGAIMRLIGAVLPGQNEDWRLRQRSMPAEDMDELMRPVTEADVEPLPPRAA